MFALVPVRTKAAYVQIADGAPTLADKAVLEQVTRMTALHFAGREFWCFKRFRLSGNAPPMG